MYQQPYSQPQQEEKDGQGRGRPGVWITEEVHKNGNFVESWSTSPAKPPSGGISWEQGVSAVKGITQVMSDFVSPTPIEPKPGMVNYADSAMDR